MIDSCWLRLTKKFERFLHVFRRNESKRWKAADVGANFIVGLILRLQPDLVHFAYDTLTQMEITRHGCVWIRYSESAHSSFLEIDQDAWNT